MSTVFQRNARVKSYLKYFFLDEMFMSDSHNQGAEESGYGGMGSSFSDKAIRLNFIRKVSWGCKLQICRFHNLPIICICVLQVYSILTVQLIVTMAFIGFFFIPSVKGFSAAHPGILYAAMAFSIILMLALVCVESIRRKTPHNMIFLGLFTVCEGWLIGDHQNVYC